MIKEHPKIFTLGERYIKDILNDSVWVEEKLDGSYFSFGKINGELSIRSKRAELYIDAPNKQFEIGINYIKSIENKIPDNVIFYCEYMNKCKHNCLTYTRVPKNNLMLFGVSSIEYEFVTFRSVLDFFANLLNIDLVPLLYEGVLSVSFVSELLNNESFLGGIKIEGIVIKNYKRDYMIGGMVQPFMAAKFVSEKFKEVNKATWHKENTGKGKFDVFKESFCTEARWLKAIQHLNDENLLENSPRDIGKLIKEIQSDIKKEESETIKEFLYHLFIDDIARTSVSGFPEWYKKYLLTSID